MSSSDVRTVTKQVIDSFTSQGFLFTALDVSNAVKDRGVRVRHRDVAPIVRELFEDDELDDAYTRTMIDVKLANGKSVSTFLYHDDGDDPDDYDGSQREQRAKAPGAAGGSNPLATASDAGRAPATVAASATSSSGAQDLSIERDGRAALSRSFVEGAGVYSPTVFLDVTGVGATLVLYSADDSDPLARLEYDGDRIYIPSQFVSAFRGSGLVARAVRGTVEIHART